MTIPAYSKRCYLTLNILAVVIITFIEFDDLTHFKKTCMLIHLCIKWDSLAKTFYIRKGKCGTNWVTLLHHFYENLP